MSSAAAQLLMTCNVVAKKEVILRKRLKFIILSSKLDENILLVCTTYFRTEEVFVKGQKDGCKVMRREENRQRMIKVDEAKRNARPDNACISVRCVESSLHTHKHQQGKTEHVASAK